MNGEVGCGVLPARGYGVVPSARALREFPPVPPNSPSDLRRLELSTMVAENRVWLNPSASI